MLGACGGEVAEGVCAGCGEGDRAECEEAARDGVRGAAYGYAVQPGGDDGGHAGAFWEDEREGAGPVEVGKALRGVAKVCECAGGGEVCDVDDKGVEQWAAFDVEDFLTGGRVQCVCGEAVNGLCGYGNEVAGAEGIRSEAQVSVVCLKDACVVRLGPQGVFL